MRRDGEHNGTQIRVHRGRGPRAALTGVLLGALLLAGCTTDDNGGNGEDDSAQPTAAAATPPPTLRAKWSIAGLNSNPEAVGKHHWMTYQEWTSGLGRNMSSSPGPTLLVDTRTGRTRTPAVEQERFPCLVPAQISDDGVVPIFWSSYSQNPGGSAPTEDCSRITVLDADTGKTLWRDDSLDLSGLSDVGAVGAHGRTVAVVDARGRSRCFAASSGAPQPNDNASCTDATERLTHADLPDLLDQDGKPAPLTPLSSAQYVPEIVEVGRTDEILLVRAANHLMVNSGIQEYRWMIRAHDLQTGETLWHDDDLTPDPHGDDTWSRDETYFVAPSGVVRVSYEHPEDVADSSDTPMVLTAVDPRTGKDIKPVGQIEGGWFNHQFDGVLVALTQQARALKSTISGFELPTW